MSWRPRLYTDRTAYYVRDDLPPVRKDAAFYVRPHFAAELCQLDLIRLARAVACGLIKNYAPPGQETPLVSIPELLALIELVDGSDPR